MSKSKLSTHLLMPYLSSASLAVFFHCSVYICMQDIHSPFAVELKVGLSLEKCVYWCFSSQ